MSHRDKIELTSQKAIGLVTIFGLVVAILTFVVSSRIGNKQVEQGETQIIQNDETSAQLATQNAIAGTEVAIIGGIATLQANALAAGPGPAQTEIAIMVEGTQTAFMNNSLLSANGDPEVTNSSSISPTPSMSLPTPTVPSMPTEISIQPLVESGYDLRLSNFDIAEENWITSGQADISDGRLILACLGYGGNCGSLRPNVDGPSGQPEKQSHGDPNAIVEDFIVEFDMQYITGTEQGMGVLFRRVDWENQYEFLVGNDRRYQLGRWKNGELTILAEGFSPAINGIGEVNRLRIEAQDDRIRLFANGEFLNEITDSTYSQGNIMLVIVRPFYGEDLEVAFDNFSLVVLP